MTSVTLYTPHFTSTMKLTRERSDSLNHGYIGPEHMLWGMLDEGVGTGVQVLKSLGADPEAIKAELATFVKAGPPAKFSGQLPFTPTAKKTIEASHLAAAEVGHEFVGTEHLLLGMLRVETSLAAQILFNHKMKAETVRLAILELRPAGFQYPEPLDKPGPELNSFGPALMTNLGVFLLIIGLLLLVGGEFNKGLRVGIFMLGLACVGFGLLWWRSLPAFAKARVSRPDQTKHG